MEQQNKALYTRLSCYQTSCTQLWTEGTQTDINVWKAATGLQVL